MLSRTERFMRSRKRCCFSKSGVVRRMTSTEAARISAVSPSSRKPAVRSMRKARKIPAAQTSGTGRMPWSSITVVCCTMLTSLSVRVMSVPVPKCSASSAEKVSVLS